jgi:hypothetical protein
MICTKSLLLSRVTSTEERSCSAKAAFEFERLDKSGNSEPEVFDATTLKFRQLSIDHDATVLSSGVAVFGKDLVKAKVMVEKEAIGEWPDCVEMYEPWENGEASTELRL